MIPIILIGAAYLIGKSIEGENFSTGGKVNLLAPNGLPSKLTPEQYKLVRTPEFKAWFGDWENDAENASKVIDEETKEPLVVYHRTYSDFYEFNNFKGMRKQGFVGGNLFYFSDDRYGYSDYGDIEIECFINLTNPTFKVNVDGEYIPKSNDGAILIYNRFGDKENVIVATKSNQIKLADGTNTTFGGSNLDIRYSTGGSLEKMYLSKENQFDFIYELEKANEFRLGSEGYKRIGDTIIRIKNHTPNWNNFYDDINNNGVLKIVNVTVGDFENSDYRRGKIDFDTFKKENPNIEVINFDVSEGESLKEVNEKIKKSLSNSNMKFDNGGKLPKSNSIQMNCYLCGEEITAPQFYKGQMYGWACIKKVNPSQKKEKGTWVLADSYEIVESNNYSYTIKVTFTPSKEPITMTIIFRKTLGGDWLANGCRFNVEKGQVYLRSDKQFYIDNKYNRKFLQKFD